MVTVQGIQTPSTLVLPPGVAASGAPGGTHGPDIVEFAAQSGFNLDPWQCCVLDHGLRLGSDGLYAALEVLLLVPRQNGKSAILAALLAAAPTMGHRKVIYSAHEFKTALEVYDLTCEIVRDSPLAEFEPKFRRSGTETGIEFTRGFRCRIHFIARSRSSGRGFTSDLLVMDEAFSLEAHTMEAVLPTMSARPNPQIWYASSAGLHDSEQLHNLYEKAQGPPAERPMLTMMEWAVEPGTPNDDRDGWARANPGLGIRLTERVIELELSTLSPQGFARERLGVFDEPDGVSLASMERWQALIDGDSEPMAPLGFGLDITPELDNSAISVAGMRIDGLAHVEIVENLPGTEWAIPRAVELWERYRAPFWIQTSSPAASFIDQLKAKGVEVKAHPKGGGAAVLFSNAIRNGAMRHLGQGSLTTAMAGARRRKMGDTWTWSRTASSVNIAPLVAASLAHYGAMVEPPTPAPPKARVL